MQWSRELYRLYGVGEDDTRFEPALGEMAVEEDRPVVARVLHEIVRDGSGEAEYRIVRRSDGQTRRMWARGRLLHGAGRQPEHVVGVVQDVTERRLAEDLLRENEARLREAQEAGKIGSWELDYATGRITWSDQQYANHGVTRETFTPTLDSTFGLMDAEDRARLKDVFMKQAHSLDDFATQYRLRCPDGQTRCLFIQWKAVRDDKGALVRLIGITQDVTNHDETLRQLDEARRTAAARERLSMLGTLLAGVAHEINNPLSYIDGNAELAQMTLCEMLDGEQEPTREALTEMRSQLDALLKGVGQIAHVTASLKQVARSADGSPRQPLIPTAIVEGVLAIASARLPLNVEIQRDLRATRTLHANPTELSQVLLNLVLNAEEALRGSVNPCVVVRSFERGDRVIIEVADNGPGIPPEIQPKLFTPFFTTKTAGTGLGLSVSHRIMEEHGGSLTFASAPGRGAVFRLVLPAGRPDGSLETDA